jgi:hypothetical protein
VSLLTSGGRHDNGLSPRQARGLPSPRETGWGRSAVSHDCLRRIRCDQSASQNSCPCKLIEGSD